MKNKVLIVIFLLGYGVINGQITITNATFPKSGDKLKYAQLNNPGNILDLKSNAGPHVWDFTVLNRGSKFEEEYDDPSEGKDASAFSQADMLLERDNQEVYFKSSTDKIEELGFGGINPIFNAPLVGKYSVRPTYRQAPLSFIGLTQSEGKFAIALSSAVFPDSLLSIFPQGFKPDSVKVEFSSSSKGLMDAYGTLKMQDQSFDVLREKAEASSVTSIFIKIGFLGWVNLEQIASQFNIQLPPFIGQFLGVKKTTIYKFHTNGKKEILVSAVYNEANELTEVTFADLGKVSATQNTVVNHAMSVYPNPASDVIHIGSGTLTEGMYLVTLTNMDGRTVYAEPCRLGGNISKKVDVSNFDSGLYILTLRDKFNQFTVTNKIVIGK